MVFTEFFEDCQIIDGELHQGRGDKIEVINPADDTLVGSVSGATTQDVVAAVAAAERAFGMWSKLAPAERSAFLERWHALILEHTESLAMIMTTEQGKPLAEARAEVSYAASYIKFFAEEGKRVYGETLQPPSQRSNRIIVIRQPLGVTVAITPWNFPLAMLTRKAGAALSAGCTMIARPSSKTPFSAIAIAKLAIAAGIPKGVLNVVVGSAEVVTAELTRSRVVRCISFTGSSSIGKKLMTMCGDKVTRLSLELGGNAPFIVFDDANLIKSVDGAVAAKLRNAGQTCVCPNRFYVHESVYDDFLDMLVTKLAKLKCGDGKQTDTDVGPLIDDAAVRKVQNHVDDAVAKGARLVVGGKLHKKPRFYEPTVLAEVSNDALIAAEETFGPIFALFRFATEADVLRRANDTEFALASYFFTEDVRRTFRVSEALEFGIVGVNTGKISDAAAPFGGIKEAGFGREGSKHGLEDYTYIKYVNLDISTNIEDSA